VECSAQSCRPKDRGRVGVLQQRYFTSGLAYLVRFLWLNFRFSLFVFFTLEMEKAQGSPQYATANPMPSQSTRNITLIPPMVSHNHDVYLEGKDPIVWRIVFVVVACGGCIRTVCLLADALSDASLLSRWLQVSCDQSSRLVSSPRDPPRLAVGPLSDLLNPRDPWPSLIHDQYRPVRKSYVTEICMTYMSNNVLMFKLERSSMGTVKQHSQLDILKLLW